ncbi:Uroporphyrinogen decarboxylase in heme biosynthesis [Puccinia graminis f. sp. tritici]|uniref:Uroporphyrinogen decarboxylase in heme biosynthesis n=1 Tax=Puccinia graminis f. sp. tritici TaxID=56615 RepID=A0A5B0S7N9_PUCGR|nr:Uroporphyrinogen decarboxylase in heme biosynthesis [Puccinia graminis f. sp. tritici]
MLDAGASDRSDDAADQKIRRIARWGDNSFQHFSHTASPGDGSDHESATNLPKPDQLKGTDGRDDHFVPLRQSAVDVICIYNQWRRRPSGLNASKATSFDTAKNWIQVHPELSARLLKKLAVVCALHLVNQIEAGCQIIQAGELSDYDFEHFSLPYLRRVSTLVKEGLSQVNIDLVPMVFFAKGANLPHQLQQLASSGYATVSLDWKVQPAYAIEALGSLSNLEMGPAHPDIRSDSDIRSRFRWNQTSASASASARGYPLALAGIRADIRPLNDP